MAEFAYLDADLVIQLEALDSAANYSGSLLSNLNFSSGQLLITDVVLDEISAGTPARQWIDSQLSSGAVTFRDTTHRGTYTGSDKGERSIVDDALDLPHDASIVVNPNAVDITVFSSDRRWDWGSTLPDSEVFGAPGAIQHFLSRTLINIDEYVEIIQTAAGLNLFESSVTRSKSDGTIASYDFTFARGNGTVSFNIVILGDNSYAIRDADGQVFLVSGDTKIIAEDGKISSIFGEVATGLNIDENGDVVVFGNNGDRYTFGSGNSLKIDDFGTRGECFPAATSISMWDGSVKNIEDVKHGDQVLSFNDSGELVPGEVDKLFHNSTQEFVRLSFEDGRDNLVATPGHRFLTETGDFMEIGHMVRLGGGDVRLVETDGAIVQAQGELLSYSAETAERFEQSASKAVVYAGNLAMEETATSGWATYNFEVAGTHTYVAEGIRVHNDSALSYRQDYEEVTNINFDENGRIIGYEATTDNGQGFVLVTATEIEGTNTTEVTKDFFYESSNGRSRLVQKQIYEQDAITKENILVDVEVIEADLLGGHIGASIGKSLTPFLTRAIIGEDGNIFEQIASDTVLGTVLKNFGDAVGDIFEVAGLSGGTIGADAVSEFFGKSFEDFGGDLVNNGVNVALGAINNLILAEIFEATNLDGIEGVVFEEVARLGLNTVTNTIAGPVFEEIASSLNTAVDVNVGTDFTDVFSGGDLTNVAGFVFSVAVRELIPGPESLEGQIASAVVSSVVSSLIGIAGFAGPAGAILGLIIGNIVDSFFEKDPHAWTYVKYDTSTGYFAVDYSDVDDGGDLQLSLSLAEQFINTMNGFVDSFGANSHNYEQLGNWTLGHAEGGLWNAGESGERFTTFSETYIDAVVRDLSNVQVNDGKQAVVRAIESIGIENLIADQKFGRLLDASGNINYNSFPLIFQNSATNEQYRQHINAEIASNQVEINAIQQLINADQAQHPDQREYDEFDLRNFDNQIGSIQAYIQQITGILDLLDELGGFTTRDEFVSLFEVAKSRYYTDAKILETAASNAQIAEDYYTYLENREAINLLIRNNPDSALTAGWVATLSLAAQMGLSDAYNLTGDDLDNVFYTADGNDIVDGGAGDDIIKSYDGDDTLTGGAGNDELYGGLGIDLLRGLAGDDILDPGAGVIGTNQFLYGHSGNDTYLVGSNSGYVTIDSFAESAGSDTDVARFTDLNLSDLSISYYDNPGHGEMIQFGWTDGQLQVVNDGHTIERFEFADGTVLTEILFNVDAAGRSKITGSSGDDVIRGTEGIDILRGLEGNDTLDAGAGTIGLNQFLYGHGGDDTYLIGSNNGYVVIDGWAETVDVNNDVVQFTDLNLSDLAITKVVNPTHGDMLQFNWEGGQLAVNLDENGGKIIEEYRFADGTTLSSIQVDANGSPILSGTNGDDVIRGTAANDLIFGDAGDDVVEFGGGDGVGYQYGDSWAGNDTYILGSDAGNVLIGNSANEVDTETIIFDDLRLSDLTISTTYWDDVHGTRLSFAWGATATHAAGNLLIGQEAINVGEYRFADGTVLSDVEVDEYGRNWLTATNGNDFIRGTDGTDILRGLAGDDTLDAGGGVAGVNQFLYGHGGDDTYLISRDSGYVVIDIYAESAGTDTDVVRFTDLTLSDLTITASENTAQGEVYVELTWDSGRLLVANDGHTIERFEFADGSTLSGFSPDHYAVLNPTLYSHLEDDILYGTDGNDIIRGGFGPDRIYGGLGNDILNVGGNTTTSWQILDGGDGDDVLEIDSNNGIVYIGGNATDGTDTLRFTDLSLSDLTITSYDHTQGGTVSHWIGEELRLSWNGGQVKVRDFGNNIERFEFADGTTLSSISPDHYHYHHPDIHLNLPLDVLNGTAGDDTITGSAGADHIFGGDGNDVLAAGGNNTTEGEALFGQGGDDTYLISSDNGLIILDQGSEVAGGGSDTIRFTDLSLSDLTITGVDYTQGGTVSHSWGVALRLEWSGGALLVANRAAQFERFEFADGTTLASINPDYYALLNPTLYGGWEDDRLHGTSGNDIIRAGLGPDRIFGGQGDDILNVGGNTTTSWQTLDGGDGNDVFEIDSNNGIVYIGGNATDGTDTLRFTDLSLSDLTITAVDHTQGGTVSHWIGEELRISWNGGEVKLRDYGNNIERFEFADGTTLSSIQVDANGSPILSGTNGDDVIRGTAANDLIFGDAGDDVVEFGGGDGVGYQYGDSWAGNDTYILGSDAGNVLIGNSANEVDTETIIFDDLRLSDLTISTTYWDDVHGTRLSFAWGATATHAAGNLLIGQEAINVGEYRFADGTVLSDVEVDEYGRNWLTATNGNDFIRGTDGTDILRGLAGDDTLDAGGGVAGVNQFLYGHGGDDTYLISRDSGYVVIDIYAESAGTDTDVVRFTDLTLSDLTITASENTAQGEVYVELTWDSGRLLVANDGHTIERFEFADGSTLSGFSPDHYAVLNPTLYSHLEDDILYGTDGNDIIRGGFGPDRIYGGLGNDILNVGGNTTTSWQILDGGDGDDVLEIDSNNGIVYIGGNATDGTDTLRFTDLSLSDLTITSYDHTQGGTVSHWIGEELRLSWNGGQVKVRDFGNNIERFEFADGTTLSSISPDHYHYHHPDIHLNLPLDVLNGTAGDDTITGSAGADHIFGGDGNDVLAAGGNNTTEGEALFGQGGDDTYLISSDNGLIILDQGSEVAGGGSDTIRFTDLSLSDLTITGVDYTQGGTVSHSWGVALRLEWSGGALLVANRAAQFERFEFADGTTLSSLDVDTNGSTALTGTIENDLISGTDGDDVLFGQSGSDTFEFVDNFGSDTIADFENDVDLISFANSSSVTGFSDLQITQDGSDTIIFANGDSIKLQGMQSEDIDQNDFLF